MARKALLASLSSVFILGKSGLPFIWKPTGTMANNGAFTSGTAFPTTYANCFMYFNANDIFAGSAAGWYFCKMSSTTVGVVYNNVYTYGIPEVPTLPISFVSTGPGAITGDTGIITGPAISVIAGSMGPKGVLRVTHFWSFTNSANNKFARVNYGGTLYYNETAPNLANAMNQTSIFNRGVPGIQISPPAGANGISQGAGLPTYGTVDSTASQDLSIQTNQATATDFSVLESWMVELMSG